MTRSVPLATSRFSLIFARTARSLVRCDLLVDGYSVDGQDRRLEAAHEILCDAARVGGCVSPDAKLLAAAPDSAALLEVRDVLPGAPVEPARDLDLAALA